MAQSPDVVLISGGNTSIGYETVKKLGSENPSYHILMGYRDLKKGKEAISTVPTPISVTPVRLDVSSDSSIAECVECVEKNYGRLDVLINNAGLTWYRHDPARAIHLCAVGKHSVRHLPNVYATASFEEVCPPSRYLCEFQPRQPDPNIGGVYVTANTLPSVESGGEYDRHMLCESSGSEGV